MNKQTLASFTILLMLGVTILGSPTSVIAQEEFIVIVNMENSATMISHVALSEIFQKKKVTWNDGVPVDPVDLADDSPVRAAFSDQVHKRSVSQIKSFWQQRIFSGADTPPIEVFTDQEVVEFVRHRSGGIGYVSANAALDGVKRLALVIPPVVVKKVPPAYTERAQRFRVQGDVKLRLLIDANGQVKEVQTIEGLKHGLTDSAIRAAKQWRFQPATSLGKPVESRLDVVVAFRL
jgi:TonB family protein